MMNNDPLLYSDLPHPEGALLWAMRAWVVGHCRREDVSARIASALENLGAELAIGHLERFMWALCRGALRPIEVNCVCYPDVSKDERLLLDILAMQQREDHDDAYTLLRSLLTERAAIVAGDSAQGLALSLAAGGTLLALRVAGLDDDGATPQHRVLH